MWTYTPVEAETAVNVPILGIDETWFGPRWLELVTEATTRRKTYEMLWHLTELFRTKFTREQAMSVNNRLLSGHMSVNGKLIFAHDINGLSLCEVVHQNSGGVYKTTLPFIQLENEQAAQLLTPFMFDSLYIAGSFLAEQIYGKGGLRAGSDIDCYVTEKRHHDQFRFELIQWLITSGDKGWGVHTYLETESHYGKMGGTPAKAATDSSGNPIESKFGTIRMDELGALAAKYIKNPILYLDAMLRDKRIVDWSGDRLFVTQRAVTLRSDVMLQALLRPILIRSLRSQTMLKSNQHIANPVWLMNRLQGCPGDISDDKRGLNIDFFDHTNEELIDGRSVISVGTIGNGLFSCPIQMQNNVGTPEEVLQRFDFAHTQLWYTMDGGISGTKAAWMAARYRLLIPTRPLDQMDTYRWVRFVKRGYRIPASLERVLGDTLLDTIANQSGVPRTTFMVNHV